MDPSVTNSTAQYQSTFDFGFDTIIDRHLLTTQPMAPCNDHNNDPLTPELIPGGGNSRPVPPMHEAANADEDIDDSIQISLQKLVIDVKGDLMGIEDDEHHTRASVTGGADPSLVDEPSYECSLHKKNRKERYLTRNSETGEWSCKEGFVCKAAASPEGSRKERRRQQQAANSVSHTSVHSGGGGGNNNNNSTSQLASNNNRSQGTNSQSQTMLVCARHKKLRSNRNLVFVNGQWVCNPQSQCQLPTGERSQGSSQQLLVYAQQGPPPPMYGSDEMRSGTSLTGGSLSTSTTKLLPTTMMAPPVYASPPFQMHSPPQVASAPPQLMYVVQQNAQGQSVLQLVEAPVQQQQPQVVYSQPQFAPAQSNQQPMYVVLPPGSMMPQQPHQQSQQYVMQAPPQPHQQQHQQYLFQQPQAPQGLGFEQPASNMNLVWMQQQHQR